MDEQNAKKNWSEDPETNPYLSLPQMSIYTYNISEQLGKEAEEKGQNEFDLGTFFEAEDGTFEDAGSVQKWLDHLQNDILKKGKTNILYQHVNHMVWWMPGVAACEAMKNLLGAEQNRKFFRQYNVKQVAGEEGGQGAAALGPVLGAMGPRPRNTKTITLTCGKLLTGVTVPPWAMMLVLTNMESASSYFQAVFRVQSPWVEENKDPKYPNRKQVLKEECFVLDFNPNRTLRLVNDLARSMVKDPSESHVPYIKELINYMPVLCHDGYNLKRLDAVELVEIATSGHTGSMLAKRFGHYKALDLNPNILEGILGHEGIVEALNKLPQNKVGLEGSNEVVVAANEAIKKLMAEKDKPSPEEQKERSSSKKIKKEIQERLLGLLRRLPLFLYISGQKEESMQEVLNTLEPEEFKDATGLTVEEFNLLYKTGVFNSPMLNDAILKFKLLEEKSKFQLEEENLPDIISSPKE